MSTEHAGRTFDWRPRFDPRSLQYRAAPRQQDMPATGVLWHTGPTLDQGSEGACVGMGCTGAVLAEPSSRPQSRPRDYAMRWYRRAQRLDEWPGEAYDGSSVLAGCLVGRERKLWSGFRWAKTPAELAAGLADPTLGPAVIGVQWSDDLYSTDEHGVMRSGPFSDQLGHCVLVFGYLPAPAQITRELWDELDELDLRDAAESLAEPSFLVLNSWGPDYGRGGRALAPLSLVRRWFAGRGEFALPENRTPRPGKGLTMAAGDELGQDELDETGDVTMRPRADELLDGDRIIEGLPDDLGQDSATVRHTRHVRGWGGDMVLVSTTAGTFTVSAGAELTVRRPLGGQD